MTKELNAKEKLFCAYYRLDRCGREAAAKSGYRSPERTAVRLLRREEIRRHIESADRQKSDLCAEVAAGYRRLAFGCVSDAVRLLLTAGEDGSLDPEGLDLFSVAELKRPKGGGLEIKFFDRLKALERLEQMAAREPNENAAAFFAALGGAAETEDADAP